MLWPKPLKIALNGVPESPIGSNPNPPFQPAVALASILHYDYIKQVQMSGDFKEEGNVEFLKSQRIFSKIEVENVNNIKEFIIISNFALKVFDE